MIFPKTKHLIVTARNPHAKDDDVTKAAQDFLNGLDSLSKAEAAEQMAALAENFDLPLQYRGAYLAQIGGAMVERGHDPQPMAAPLRKRLQAVLEAAAKLADACRARMPERAADADEDDDDAEEGEDEQFNEAFETARRQLAPTMPAEEAAWNALNTFWRPGIAVYSKSDLARLAARELRPLAQRSAEFHPGAHWLQLIWSVLDDEPLVVIEPETRVGIIARSSGVVDNFQLHVLLMESFPASGVFSGSRVPRNVAEQARGLGPQELEDVVTGYWNLYSWRALLPSKQLPRADDFASSKDWIWNEGQPADIPQLDGRRVVLLGPPSLERTWRAMRMFDQLAAELKIERQLSSGEVDEWLTKMVTAK